jgi:hypothetical protein
MQALDAPGTIELSTAEISEGGSVGRILTFVIVALIIAAGKLLAEQYARGG